jgi:transcriptional regulator with XRE-family HTH domain
MAGANSRLDGLQLRRLFAANFRRLRAEKGLKQRDLGIPQKTVSAAESGRSDLMLSTMARLAEAVGADVPALLTKEV